MWAPDNHQSTFSWSWLRENCYSDAELDRQARDMTTKALVPGSAVPSVEYERMMNEDDGLLEMLHNVIENGLTVIKNTPSNEKEVKRIAERVAPVSHTYGYAFILGCCNVATDLGCISVLQLSVRRRLRCDRGAEPGKPSAFFLQS